MGNKKYFALMRKNSKDKSGKKSTGIRILFIPIKYIINKDKLYKRGGNMKLKDLISELQTIKIIGDEEVEITEVKTDSNFVTKGSLFIAHRGKGSDGNDYVKQVEMYGGAAIVSERETDTHLTQVIVKDTRKAECIICGKLYGNVYKKMRFVGVLGTNGKTTTAHMIYHALKDLGENCAVIGTLGTYYNDKYFEPTLTTPDPVALHKTLYEMYEAGVRIVVMEVSAHAVYWKKIYGIDYEVAVFTNFTQDHLDFFGDMNAYKQAKIDFFRQNNCKYIVTNSDDSVGREILELGKKTISYGIENPADVFAIDIKENSDGISFVLNLFDCIYKVDLSYIGKFNVSNAMGALTALSLLGANTEKAVLSIQKQKGVSGRLERVFDKNFSVYVDYAHTPDGLMQSLNAMRKICKGKLICLFGCGGNRDKDKRHKMGKISGELADFTVITSDNPRYEEPMEIISDIEKGVLSVSKRYVVVEKRESGIEYALSIACDDDVVLIAGKGSENYQEILGIKHLYNDKDTVREILRG